MIEKYVESGSVVWTDSFSAYNDYSLDGYTHQTGNQSKNYVNPNSRVHTLGIERAWLDAKSWYKRARGNRTYLQRHLNEAAWRKLRTKETRDGTLFSAFLNDLQRSTTT